MNSIAVYNAIFLGALHNCTNLSSTKVLERYIFSPKKEINLHIHKTTSADLIYKMKFSCFRKLLIVLFVSRLLAVCCKIFIVGHRLYIYVLDKYARGLVVVGATMCSRLL